MKDEIDQWVFCILKPDILERNLMGEILTRIERTYLRVTDLNMRHKTFEWCKKHYAHVKEEPFFHELMAFMCSRSILGFIVSGPLAVGRMRMVVGPTQKAAPGTIRGDYGYHPARLNCIHVSESQEAAEREYQLFMNYETDMNFKTDEVQDASETMPQRR